MRKRSNHSHVKRILHPTDFSAASHIAFLHALKIALAHKASLHVVHITTEPEQVDRDDFPAIRDRLVEWGLLPSGASRSDVGTLGIHIHKMMEQADDPVKGLAKHLDRFPADLIVMATHQKHGLDRWLHPRIAGKVASHADCASLLVPHGAKGFVRPNGEATLNQILAPIDRAPMPQRALDELLRILGPLETGFQREITLLHVGDHVKAPTVHQRDQPGWSWKHELRQGPVNETILSAADEIGAGLIVMATEGRDGFLDALRGSTTEQIVNQIKCPVLAVPAERD